VALVRTFPRACPPPFPLKGFVVLSLSRLKFLVTLYLVQKRSIEKRNPQTVFSLSPLPFTPKLTPSCYRPLPTGGVVVSSASPSPHGTPVALMSVLSLTNTRGWFFFFSQAPYFASHPTPWRVFFLRCPLVLSRFPICASGLVLCLLSLSIFFSPWWEGL